MMELSEVAPNADLTMTLSMEQFEKIQQLGRGAHGALRLGKCARRS